MARRIVTEYQRGSMMASLQDVLAQCTRIQKSLGGGRSRSGRGQLVHESATRRIPRASECSLAELRAHYVGGAGDRQRVIAQESAARARKAASTVDGIPMLSRGATVAECKEHYRRDDGLRGGLGQLVRSLRGLATGTASS